MIATRDTGLKLRALEFGGEQFLVHVLVDCDGVNV